MDWRVIEIAVSTASVKSQSKDQPPLIVKVFQDGQVGISGKKYSIMSLIEQSRKNETDIENKTILLKPEEDVSLQVSIDVLQKFTLSGMTEVSFFIPLMKDK